MGYYTYYTLDVDPWDMDMNDDDFDREMNLLGTESLNQGMFTVRDLVYGDGATCKWYEHEAEMLELSKRYPRLLFSLHGWGEDRYDIWSQFFLDGQCTKAEMAQVIHADFFLQNLLPAQ